MLSVVFHLFAAKSLQSCPTLCDPIDSSPPGSPVPGILQARTLEWVAISVSNAGKWKVKVKSLSRVWLLATPWSAAHQAPPSMGFSRQEYWSGVPLPSLKFFISICEIKILLAEPSQSLIYKYWRRQWHPTPVLLPRKSHGWRSLVGCSLWSRSESDTTEWLHFHFSLSCIGEGNGNPLQCSCLENARDGGAWWAAVYGVAQSQTWLKRLSSSRSRDFFKKIGDTKGTFHAKMGSINDRNGRDLTEAEDIKKR